MKKEIYRAETRGGADHGWLRTKHSFSFAEYYDPARMGFGVLRVLNDDAIAPATGFGRHGHSNMEIITIPLEGTVTHGDSMGNQGEVKVGEVQIMSAGSGVVHSEENKDPQIWLKLFQIWIETDPQYVDSAPRYKQQMFSELERKNKWQLLVAPPEESALDILQQAWIWRATLDPALPLSYMAKDAEHGIFVLVISGEIEIEGEVLRERDAIGLTEVTAMAVRAVESADVLLLEIPQ